jgi:hypothetical protein
VQIATTADCDASLCSMQEVYYLQYHLLHFLSLFFFLSFTASLSVVYPVKSKTNYVVFEANVRRVIWSDSIRTVATSEVISE